MATISLYANKINNMPGLLRDVKIAVNDLKGDFNSLTRKCRQVPSDVCNLEDVISTISAATRLQETKFEALETLQENIAEFAEDAARIDRQVEETIESEKKDFYKKYGYLKPDCEKTWLERRWEELKEGCKKVAQWCAENWEALLVLVGTVIAVIAVVVLCVVTFGAATVLVAALVGALVGIAGQLISDVITFARTGEWEGGLTDYLASAIGGAVGGLLTLTGQVALAAAADAGISSLLSDSLGSLFGGERKSLGEMLVGASFDIAIGAIAGWVMDAAITKSLKYIPDNLTCLKRLAGKGSYEASYKMALTKLSKGIIKKIGPKTIRNGVVPPIVENLLDNILEGLGISDIPKDLADQYGVTDFVDHAVKKQMLWTSVGLVTGLPQLSLLGVLPSDWLFGGNT